MDRHELPALPRSRDDDYSAALLRERLEIASRAAGHGLAHIAGLAVDPHSARGNVENMIGFAQVPLGLAGPLCVDTSAGLLEVFVPMATNEGALVASHSRGMRLLNAGGGARSRVVHEGLTQNPMLAFDDAEAALRAAELVPALLPQWRAALAERTNHGALSGAKAQIIGRRLILRLEFTTGDAIGINMAAQAADHCSRSLAQVSGARLCYVHGQDVEKRANARALIEGRGRSVVVDATIPRAVLAGLARTTPEALVDLQRSYSVGFAQLGTQNWLVQSANGLAAVLLACGQDVAYLPECATGFLDLDMTAAGDLYASATLPSLLVGTVGGGSQKGTAAECLAILGCAGTGHANTFAEILGAVVLAGDLSLFAAFASDEFIAAHERLGRNRPAPRT